MRIMAIDYGDAHTGIAVSDPTGFLTGFTTVITAYRPDRVAEQVAAPYNEKHPALVFGKAFHQIGELCQTARALNGMYGILLAVHRDASSVFARRRFSSSMAWGSTRIESITRSAPASR